MIPPLHITIENFPEVRDDYSKQFEMISEHMEESVLQTLAEGGRPPWERTKRGAIARLFERFAHTIRSESDATSSTTFGGGTPDTFAHQFGAKFTQTVTPKQRSFFWYKFGETGEDFWKAMALSKVLQGEVKKRPFMVFQEEDVDWIMELMAGSVFIFDSREATFGNY